MQTITGRYAYRGTNHDTACGNKTGTAAGYKRHKRQGEPACGACLEAERVRGLKRNRKAGMSPRKSAECGTATGYKKHLREGVVPCDDCTYANRLLSRHVRQLYTTGIYCRAPQPCSSAGYEWHQTQGEEPCPACTHWNQKESQS